MFDETNRTEEQELMLPDNLFDDEATEQETSPSNQDAEEKETIRIKYNGEERDITLDEARVLAQKGMNYDHVVAERDTKYQRELEFLDRVAGEKGMTRAEYMNMHESQKQNAADTVKSVAQDAAERARGQIKRISDSLGFTGPWATLFNRYPNLARESAYSELSEKVRGGLTPLEAYQEKLLLDKERELSAVQSTADARWRSVGPISGEGTAFIRDDFLEGFTATD